RRGTRRRRVMMAENGSPTLQVPVIFGGNSEEARRYQEEVQRAMLQTQKMFEVLGSREDPKVGLTPRDVVWKRGTAELYHYRRTTPEVYPVPILMVHSLVNKPYILDLTPGNSFVEFMVNHGLDVYLIDWGTPRPEDRRLRLDDYVCDLLPTVIEVMQETSDAEDFSLFGYCMGGQLALMYAATHPDQIPFPGEAFRQMTKEIVQRNKLYEGTLEIGGRNASLANITCSFLAVLAEQDHIVPLAAANCQPDLVSSTDKEMVVMPGGHV